MKDSNNIKVICRIRPLNTLEKSNGGESCIEINDDKSVGAKVGIFFL